MKSILIRFCFLYIFIPLTVLADPQSVLQQRLDQVSSIYVRFHQKVMDNNDILVQESNGELWVRRPNQFYWHVFSPDENILLSDGRDMFFYHPLINQVVIYRIKNDLSYSPLMLIVGNQKSDWKDYNIIQKNDNFFFTPKKSEQDFIQFSIEVTKSGVINCFSVMEESGLRTSYDFNNQKNILVDINKFKLIFPSGVTIDDQR
ncbi:Outer-membrane lipoprotein carrier protein [Candidatus Erwinia haradaeae]|uniref:Outer-membrane lipoprotein carrier protein n=1 Tax=Candidatus Erwinia haradaeae TaxID=1922217 RepID=A0A451CYP1_9GAMM|nr:outer membrane lipoprotein chaperone LolA [Candidatus Erwinia haradaeae]VFP78543.1 Outer-membrane lipoprotein carrier protein [Candidatus Erwinia haradaeae]